MTKHGNQIFAAARARNAEKGFRVLSYRVATRRDAKKLLEAVEHALDAVPILICLEVAGRQVLSVGFRRNDWSDPMDQGFFAQEITVIAFVGNGQPRLADRYRQQVRNCVVVRSFAACQDEAKRGP
ncbi:hypothetical protein ADZ37_21675 [Pannonibacter phragmitetus]|nr:hypothetical protein ADZ37_21675 [Pannonibacter phragmitetus]